MQILAEKQRTTATERDLVESGIGEPFDHHQRLHQGPHGVVLVWERLKSEKRWTKIKPSDPVAGLIAGFAGEKDAYLSVNEFDHWRLISQLRSLRANYVDIDGCTDLDLALETLVEAKMPAPSFVVFSGRGLHFYWVLEPTPSKALPVWQAVQDALVKSLAGIGSDSKARDCTRVLRLVGSINSKNGAQCRGLVLTGANWTLHQLANEVLGERPATQTAQLHDLSVTRARQGKASRVYSGSIYAWWYLVFRDLCAVADHHWFGGVPEGRRDNFLFLMSAALSWFAHIAVLEKEIVRVAKSFTPTLTDREVKTQMGAVMSRAKASADGKKIIWHGAAVDPRYRFKAETMRQMLGDLLPPDLHGQLRALAPAGVIKARKQAREESRESRDRVADGRYGKTRAEYMGNAAQRAVSARLMRAKGMTQAEIAGELGISRMSVSRYLKIDV